MAISQNKHLFRKRNRLREWDYSTPHWYYVTICTKNHHKWFGEIIEGNMVLNENGEIVKLTWYDLPNHNSHVTLDEFVIMPNHIHGIIIINNAKDYNVGADSKSVLTSDATINRTGLEPVPTQKYHGIPEIIRQFKGFSTRRINARRNTPGQTIWQRSYYDHIIRNEKSLYKIRQYIYENPLYWETDKNNPKN